MAAAAEADVLTRRWLRRGGNKYYRFYIVILDISALMFIRYHLVHYPDGIKPCHDY